MKIVQINAVYGVGSTGKTTAQLHKYLLENGYDSYVFWATNSTQTNDRIIQIGNKVDRIAHAILSRVYTNQGFHSQRETKKLVKQLKKIQPDVVHLRNLHSNYINLPILFNYLKENDIPVVMTLHDCWFFTGGCVYFTYKNCEQYFTECKKCPEYKNAIAQKNRRKVFKCKKKYYQDLDLTVIGVSKWVSDSAKKSGIFSNNVYHDYIYNWIDLNIFKPCENVEKVREKYQLKKDTKIVLGVAQSWRDGKGFEVFQKLSQCVDENTQVVLVGDAQGRENTSTLKFIGRTENQGELAALYSLANVFANPSPAETFGKVTAEALACGTPVVAYNNTGTAELVQNGCGWLVEDGNEEAFIEQVLNALRMVDTDKELRCRFVRENFEFSQQAEKYVRLYQKIIEGKNSKRNEALSKQFINQKSK